MAWFVYILLCDQKTFYIGFTDNLDRRVAQHRKGESFFTKKFSNLQLVYQEGYPTRSRAEAREQQIKRWSVAKKRALIEKDIESLKKLSKGHGVGGLSR